MVHFFSGHVKFSGSFLVVLLALFVGLVPFGEANAADSSVATRATPVVTISAPSVTATSIGPVTYEVTYTGATTTNLTPADVVLNTTGTATGTASVFTFFGTQISIGSITGVGTIGVSIAPGTSSDGAGNFDLGAGPSATFTVAVSEPNPTLTIGAPSPSSTTGGPVDFSLTYTGAASATIVLGDITLNTTGTATGTVTILGFGNEERIIRIDSISGDGTIGISIAPGTSSDGMGNFDLGAGPSATFTVSEPNPLAPVLTLDEPSPSSTTGGPVSFEVSYTGAASVTMVPGDITLNTTGTATGTVTVGGFGNEERIIRIVSISGDGTIGISVAAGTSSDGMGNFDLGAGPSATFIVDNTPPTLSIGLPSQSITSAGPVSFGVSYSGATFPTLTPADVTLNSTGTATATSVTISGFSPFSQLVTINGITGDGTLGISIDPGTSTDAVGNVDLGAGPSDTFAVDNTPPTMMITGPDVSMTDVGPVVYTVDYSGASSVSLAAGDIAVNASGDALAGTVSVSGSGVFQRTVTLSSISGTGTLGISIAAGTATDALGNLEANGATSNTVSVVNNLVPVLDPIGDKTVPAEGLLWFQITASDPEGGTVSISASNLPDGAELDAEGFLFWRPTMEDIGVFSNVTFTATDDGSPPASGSESITITVTRNSEDICFAFDDIFVQFEIFAREFGLPRTDFNEDGLPEDAALLLMEVASCVRKLPGIAESTKTAYDVNLIIFDGETIDDPEVVALREVIAALMLMGAEMKELIREALALDDIFLLGDYENVTCLGANCLPLPIPGLSIREGYLGLDRAVTSFDPEPYLGGGDPDGDSLSNATEYANTVANKGTIEDFALAATDPGTDGTDPPDTGGGGGGGGGGCFIATAAYGSPLAREVEVLRTVRDERLMTNPLGALFVDSYYRLSPPVADAVGQSEGLAQLVRGVLWIVIAVLNSGLLMVMAGGVLLSALGLGVRRFRVV